MYIEISFHHFTSDIQITMTASEELFYVTSKIRDEMQST